jgi:hypothetical protein
VFRLTTGTGLLESQVRYAAGFDVTLPDHIDGYAGIQFLTATESGVLDHVSGVESAAAVPMSSASR